MSSPSNAHLLQAWLQRHYRQHPDFQYLNIQDSDETGLFWKGRYLYQQMPKKPWQARFVKRIDYNDMVAFNIKRIDAHLPAPVWLYPRQQIWALMFLAIVMLFLMAMVWTLQYIPTSFFPWIFPAFLSVVFFNVHEHFLQTVFKYRQTRKTNIQRFLSLPRSLKWLLRCVLLALFFVCIGIPIHEWLNRLEPNTVNHWFKWAMAYLIAINLLDSWLSRRLKQQNTTDNAHYFVLQLQLVNGQWVDFAYAREQTVLQHLQQHLYTQQPRLQDAEYGQTQS